MCSRPASRRSATDRWAVALGTSERATNCGGLALVLARLIGNAFEAAQRLERTMRDGELDDRVGLRLVVQVLDPRVHAGAQVLRGDRNERGLFDRASPSADPVLVGSAAPRVLVLTPHTIHEQSVRLAQQMLRQWPIRDGVRDETQGNAAPAPSTVRTASSRSGQPPIVRVAWSLETMV